jgi:hypothetical protein
LSVVEPPLHIVVTVAELLMFGPAITCTGIFTVRVHPFTSVPITVYVVLVSGVTRMELPLWFMGCQLYVLAPFAFSRMVLPGQIVSDDADAVTLGNAFTVMVTVLVVEQEPLVPVTV